MTTTTTRAPLPVNLDAIPAELQASDCWVVWRSEQRNGKPTKIPYSPLTGKRASSVDPETWGGFIDAAAAYKLQGKWDGIGFVFSADGPFSGIDLDKCRDAETGQICDWTDEQRKAFPDGAPSPAKIIDALASYSEVSPSGTGVKIIIRGTLAADAKNRVGSFESYSNGRFFTLTGQRLENTPATVSDAGTALRLLSISMGAFRKAGKGKPSPHNGKGPRNGKRVADLVKNATTATGMPTDEIILSRAFGASNAGKFHALWAGDISGHNNDASAADSALATLLGFYTADAGQVERLMRQSGLVRPKWDEMRGNQTYLALTIGNALEIIADRYDWSRDPKFSAARARRNAAGKMVLETGQQPKADREATGEQAEPESEPESEPDDQNDQADEDDRLPAKEIIPEEEGASYLAQHMQDGLPLLRVFNGEFMRWRDGRYRPVDEGRIRADVTRFINENFFKVTQSAVGNVLGQIRAQATIFGEDMPDWLPGADHPAWKPSELLVTRDKIIHLPSLCAGSTDYAIPSTPVLFTANALDFDWLEPDACTQPRRWLRFLEELWGDDEESIEALQTWFGYNLAVDTSQQKMFGLFGPKRSGKGTISRTLQCLVGHGNVVSPTLSSLANGFGLWQLLGKSLAVIGDARMSGRVDAAVVVERILSITGEDLQTVERKHLPPVTCRMPVRFMLMSNELPKLTDASGALVSRMIVLKLTKSWYGAEDTALEEKLTEELPGILWWAISGWALLRRRGRFIQPQSAAAMVAELEELASPVGTFVRERCIVGPEYTISRKDLYDAFVAWCEENGKKYVPDDAGFGRDLHAVVENLGQSKNRVNGKRVRFHVGVDLLPDEEE